MSAVENTGVRGKLKRALIVFMNADVRDVQEGLEDASIRTKHEWRLFYEQWADAEVRRIFAELEQLVAPVHKAAWEIARDKARQQSKRRLTDLQREIIVHVRKAGGEIDYAPAFVAKTLARGRKSLAPGTVDKAMLRMCQSGAARKVSARKGAPARFMLLN